MANYEDYLPGGKNYVGEEEPSKVDKEIVDAAAQTEERTSSTPEEQATDWRTKYEEMNKAFSRQGNLVGEQKRMIDDYITSSTHQEPSVEEVSPEPISVDSLYDNPQEAIDRAIANHPSVKRAEALEIQLNNDRLMEAQNAFTHKHDDYVEITQSPEFANWVVEQPMRQSLALAADGHDYHAADALFTLYKADKALSAASSQATNDAAVAAAELSTPAGGEPPAPDSYSRSEMLSQKILAKQGNLEAEAYVNKHAVAYREALGSGNVRD